MRCESECHCFAHTVKPLIIFAALSIWDGGAMRAKTKDGMTRSIREIGTKNLPNVVYCTYLLLPTYLPTTYLLEVPLIKND